MLKLVSPFIDIFKTKDYAWFDSNRMYNLNIIGVRNSNSTGVNSFDDSLFLIYRKSNLDWHLTRFDVTTDPGLTPLLKPFNKKGTSILVPGQYLGAYCIDKHQGKYDALCQRLGPVKVYRDNNRNGVHDLDPTTITEGMFGINIHRAGIDSQKVDNWSAGCTVFKRAQEFERFMSLLRVSAKLYGNKFTYTLIESKDLE